MSSSDNIIRYVENLAPIAVVVANSLKAEGRCFRMLASPADTLSTRVTFQYK